MATRAPKKIIKTKEKKEVKRKAAPIDPSTSDDDSDVPKLCTLPPSPPCRRKMLVKELADFTRSYEWRVARDREVDTLVDWCLNEFARYFRDGHMRIQLELYEDLRLVDEVVDALRHLLEPFFKVNTCEDDESNIEIAIVMPYSRLY